jgi:hypothetical protein
MLRVDEAKKELAEKSYAQIQKETAWKWASRAAAAFDLCKDEVDLAKKVAMYQTAQEFEHEAVEHAALYEDCGTLLTEIHGQLEPHKDAAVASLNEALS